MKESMEDMVLDLRNEMREAIFFSFHLFILEEPTHAFKKIKKDKTYFDNEEKLEYIKVGPDRTQIDDFFTRV